MKFQRCKWFNNLLHELPKLEVHLLNISIYYIYIREYSCCVTIFLSITAKNLNMKKKCSFFRRFLHLVINTEITNKSIILRRVMKECLPDAPSCSSISKYKSMLTCVCVRVYMWVIGDGRLWNAQTYASGWGGRHQTTMHFNKSKAVHATQSERASDRTRPRRG